MRLFCVRCLGARFNGFREVIFYDSGRLEAIKGLGRSALTQDSPLSTDKAREDDVDSRILITLV